MRQSKLLFVHQDLSLRHFIEAHQKWKSNIVGRVTLFADEEGSAPSPAPSATFLEFQIDVRLRMTADCSDSSLCLRGGADQAVLTWPSPMKLSRSSVCSVPEETIQISVTEIQGSVLATLSIGHNLKAAPPTGDIRNGACTLKSYAL